MKLEEVKHLLYISISQIDLTDFITLLTDIISLIETTFDDINLLKAFTNQLSQILNQVRYY